MGKSLSAAVGPDGSVHVVLVDQDVEEQMEWRADVPSATQLSADAEDGVDAIADLSTSLEAALDASDALHKVILIDSMSALLRAVNASGNEDPRILTGGIMQTALIRVRHVLGLGRALSDGRTVTVVCTATSGGEVEADELLSRELIGTGNAELHLHPVLVRSEVFPPIDLERSGARGTERILGDGEATRRASLRARCLERGDLAATELVLDGLRQFGSLDALLASLEHG
jgi:transcription termination factor Rho